MLMSGQMPRHQHSSKARDSRFSHELAAIMLTECIQHILHVTKAPLYALLLDAKSAYDKDVKECAVQNTYLDGSKGQGLLYIDCDL